jgi:uncharacterized PurR-regulated membrane protein YhhQ (DUF165 family)
MLMPHDNKDTKQILPIKQMYANKSSTSGKKLNPTLPKTFWSYPFMITIMSCLQIMAVLYSRKFVTFLGFNISEGGLLFLPLVLYSFQIVSECYGWQYARQIVWCNLIVNSITTVICFTSQFIPYSNFNHLDLKTSYISLIDTMWVSAAVSSIFVFFSDYITSALMCWSRFHWNGRFIGIRILILHCLSEVILAFGAIISLSFNHYGLLEIYNFVINSFIARTIISIILLPVIRLIVWFIQNKIEGVVVFDYKRDFNPFKFKVDPNLSVQFSATGWDKVDVSKVDIKKIAYDFYNDDFFNNLPGNPLKNYQSKKGDNSADQQKISNAS